MTTAMGIGESWHSEGPATEAEAFERFKLKLGEETIVTGALSVGGGICIPSRAMKSAKDELELFYLDQHGEARILKVREGCQEILAAALSLAW